MIVEELNDNDGIDGDDDDQPSALIELVVGKYISNVLDLVNSFNFILT